MPVILDEEAWRLWLDPELRDEGLLQSLLEPARRRAAGARPVSPLVNNANNEGAALLLPPIDERQRGERGKSLARHPR